MRLFADASSRVADPWLRRAFVLAENGRGTTSPNPVVGCVIVRDGRVVGEGWHALAGGPHAEVAALAAAGPAARGASAYVTLEPCDHTGRTGPCTLALREAGVREVVAGMPDPDLDVSGRGAETLRAAGVAVRFADDPSPFLEQNEAWLKRVVTGEPWVRVKVALTLDGCAALRPGVRSAISGRGGADVTRRLRTIADAVLVGAATAAIDDPALTVRDAEGVLASRQPLRAVLARSAQPPASLRVFNAHGSASPGVLLAPDDMPVESSVAAVRYPVEGGVPAALRALADAYGLTNLLVEPGPRLFAALLAAEAIDELVVVTAGGVGGAAAVSLMPEEAATDGERLVPAMCAVEAGVIEGDAVTLWRRASVRE